MKNIRYMTVLSIMAIVFSAGCSNKNVEENIKIESDKIIDEKAEDNNKLASSDDMSEPVEIVSGNSIPITADNIKDGTYNINVDSSSSMFNITKCDLTVKNGSMSAVMTMSGKGYLKIFIGTGKEALNASEDDYIGYVENENGEHTFAVAVDALDKEIDCAAFSKKKEKWYDRKLVFRADSIPLNCFEEGVIKSVDSLNLEDGVYSVETLLTGGSGRADIISPAMLTINDKKAMVKIEWSSSNYDYMKVDEQIYYPVNTSGNSIFELPVTVFDWKIPVIANTTAMSEPHEVEYTLLFKSETIKKVD